MARLNTSLHCEIVTDFCRLQSLAPEWDRLFAATTPAGGMFQSWGWTEAFWNVHGRQLALCAPVVFDGSSVIGILPAAVRGGMVRLLGAPYADYNGLLCAAGRETDVVRLALTALLNAPLPWTDCVFEGVPAASPLVNGSAALPGWLRAHRQVVLGYACPAAVSDGTLFDRLSRKERLRKQENRLARRGRLSFRHLEQREEILDRHLDAFFAMHIARQAMTGVRSQFLSPDARAMLRALVATLDPARELRFSVLELDGRPIAYHFGLQYDGKYVWYLPTFDLEFWDDSPGGVLLRQALKYAHEQRLTEFDFTIGEEEYKNRFANDVRQTFTVYLDRRPRAVRVQTRRLLRGTRDRVRRSPSIGKHARRVRAAADDIARHLRQPAAAVGSAALALLRPVLPAERTIACERRGQASGPSGARVTRLTLSDFALLRLKHEALDAAAMDTGRRCMKQGDALYLVSVGPSEHVFRVSPAAATPPAAGHATAPVIREGPSLAPFRSRTFADALSALLCTVPFPAGVSVCSARGRAVMRAIGQSGYVVVRTAAAPTAAGGTEAAGEDPAIRTVP